MEKSKKKKSAKKVKRSSTLEDDIPDLNLNYRVLSKAKMRNTMIEMDESFTNNTYNRNSMQKYCKH